MTVHAYLDDFGYALGSRKLGVEESHAAGLTTTSGDRFLDAGFRYHHVCSD